MCQFMKRIIAEPLMRNYDPGHQTSDVNKDLTFEAKDKDQTYKDKDKD